MVVFKNAFSSGRHEVEDSGESEDRMTMKMSKLEIIVVEDIYKTNLLHCFTSYPSE